MSERIFRVVSLLMLVLGFVVSAGGMNRAGAMVQKSAIQSAPSTILDDVRLAEEANALNEGRWNQDVNAINQDGLARAQEILEQTNADAVLTAAQK